MTNDLETIPCPKCRQPAKEVIYAEKQTRKGWYCPACKEFIVAIWRERLMQNQEISIAP